MAKLIFMLRAIKFYFPITDCLFRLHILFLCLLLIYSCPLSQAQSALGGSNLFNDSGTNNPTNPMNKLTRPTFPLGSKTGENDAESNWQPATFPLFPIRYLSLPGLNEVEQQILSQNYFVVINDSNIKSFAQLYKDNRDEHISSFVTADGITHAVFSFQNNIRLKVIERSLVPALESLLISMVRNNEMDYKLAEDAEIKEEIKYNLAFLTVGLKLLVPDFPLPGNPGVRQLVQDELDNLKQGKLAKSVIFHRQEDFAAYKPIGFYKLTASSRYFYSCYQWLAKMYLELSDITSDTNAGNGNEFRRAFLLFQSLMKVKTQSGDSSKTQQSGLSIWNQTNKIIGILSLNAISKSSEPEPYLLPDALARALASSNASTVTIPFLSNPLNRTRLLLTIRSYAPRQLNATSIFSLSRRDANKEKQLKFHLFNTLYEPTQELALPAPIFRKDDKNNFAQIPIALLLLQNNGVRWANKILTSNASKLDEQIINRLTDKQNATNGDNNPGSLDLFWNIYAGFSNPYPERAQLFFQTGEWRTFCLERQAAAWVDNLLTINSGSQKAELNKPIPNASGAGNNSSTTNLSNTNTSTNATISNTIRRFGIGSWRTNNDFNYLEPAFDLYNKMAESEWNLENSLNQSGLFPVEYLHQSHDFVRLLQRLATIAKLELNLDMPKNEDQSLLATIDKLLRVIDSPLPGKLFVRFPTTGSNTNSLKTNNYSQTSLAGVNMELGYPSTILVIIQYKRCYYLLRGAAYSYHEQSGDEINEKHWQRQVEFGFLETPFWCQSFQRSHPSSN